MQTCYQHAARNPEEEFLGKRDPADDAASQDIAELIERHRERLSKELFYKANHQVISNLSRSTFIKPRQLKVLARRVVRAGSFDSAETASTLADIQCSSSTSPTPKSPASSQSSSPTRGDQTANANIVSNLISEFESHISHSVGEQQLKSLKHVNEYLKKICLSKLSQINSKVQNIVINPHADLALALLRLSCRKAKVSKGQYQSAASHVARCSSDQVLYQSDTYRTVVSLFQQHTPIQDQDC